MRLHLARRGPWSGSPGIWPISARALVPEDTATLAGPVGAGVAVPMGREAAGR
jgi:hypothetical protein